MADFIPKKRGPYKLPERMRTMQYIRSLLIEGYTYNQIMQQLGLSDRTFHRYLSAVFQDDRRLLAENVSDEEVLNQMAICRDRLLKQRRDILEQIANNPEVEDDKARVAAHHLAAEISAAVMKLYTEGPGMLAARHAFPRTSLTGPGTTGARLVIKEKVKEEEYDELDYEDEVEEQEEEVTATIPRRKASSLSPREEEEQEKTWR